MLFEVQPLDESPKLVETFSGASNHTLQFPEIGLIVRLHVKFNKEVAKTAVLPRLLTVLRFKFDSKMSFSVST